MRLLPGLLVLALVSPTLAQNDKKAVKQEVPEERIQPGDRLFIHATETLPDQPIRGTFRVEPSGKVALGPLYGRVLVAGLTPEEAEQQIRKSLKTYLRDTNILVTWHDPEAPRQQPEMSIEQRLRLLNEQMQALKTELEAVRRAVQRTR